MKNRRFIRALLYGLVSLTRALASCGGEGGGTPPSNTGVRQVRQVSGVNGRTAVLRIISFTPSNPLGINSGTQRQFSARGYFLDHSEQDLTTMVYWTSSDISIATISNAPDAKGQAVAVSKGYCSIPRRWMASHVQHSWALTDAINLRTMWKGKALWT
jgi:hypothetical protein